MNTKYRPFMNLASEHLGSDEAAQPSILFLADSMWARSRTRVRDQKNRMDDLLAEVAIKDYRCARGTRVPLGSGLTTYTCGTR